MLLSNSRIDRGLLLLLTIFFLLTAAIAFERILEFLTWAQYPNPQFDDFMLFTISAFWALALVAILIFALTVIFLVLNIIVKNILKKWRGKNISLRKLINITLYAFNSYLLLCLITICFISSTYPIISLLPTILSVIIINAVIILIHLLPIRLYYLGIKLSPNNNT